MSSGVPSLLRFFPLPVLLDFVSSSSELNALAKHESGPDGCDHTFEKILKPSESGTVVVATLAGMTMTTRTTATTNAMERTRASRISSCRITRALS